ncbi:MAG: flagellar biosynthesis protein FlhA [Alphaproteobacteria bacterium]|jgi:flagellar biosynthesis protein FlhA|nr:flagellar biosynthesis protein FlhA [Alphaproteobacteria bacterium]MDA8881179.1 flagellar biosynthesis protein FlhA [Alphaproteobacteria bacterium]
MEMTLQRLGLGSVGSIISSVTMPAGILVLVAMMVLPLPAFLLDTFFVTNILVSLLVLMVALQTNRPLDFSSFPTLLLIATVLRLGLNVASTRIILGSGHEGPDAAGKVIEAFGAFVIAGNFAVGIFVFIILVIINLVVITKGAGRVSEVSARFTLDAMPGKQMAIDADLNAGVLTNEEARARREEITSEADFYGAMDGASKFVKGDAIAGILILAINIVGGLIIGLGQHDLTLETAAESYIMLSIGDGLVAQIPSLLLAIATAIIVTRVSTTQDMGTHIGHQVGLFRAWVPVSGVLLLIGFVPGMPNFLFLIAAAIAGLAAYFVRNGPPSDAMPSAAGELSGPDGAAADSEENKKPDRIELADITDNSAVSIQLGYGLIEMVDEQTGGPLINRITGIRKQISRNLGFVIPAVRVRDDMSLSANQYRVRIGQTIVGEDIVYPERKLAIPGDTSAVKLQGIDVKEPTFGMDAVWVEAHKQAEAETNGYVVVEPETVMTTHISHVMTKYAGELLGQDDVQALLDNLSGSAPSLVQSVVPKLIPLHSLTGILRELLAERVPISDLRRILETLANLAGKNLTVAESAEALRPGLAGLLIQQIAPLSQPLPVITLSSELEHMLISMARQSGEAGLMLDNALAERLIKSVSQASEKAAAEGRQAVMVVSPAIRKQLSAIVRHHIDDMIIMGFTELPDSRKITVIATISGDDDKDQLPA